MDVLLHMILPVVTLTVIQLGGTMRYVRTSMLEVINQITSELPVQRDFRKKW